MDRATIRQLLQDGHELDGLALSRHDLVLARGKLRWKGTEWRTVETGNAVSLMIRHNGQQLRVPLVEPVLIRQGEPLQIEFGPKWQGRVH